MTVQEIADYFGVGERKIIIRKNKKYDAFFQNFGYVITTLSKLPCSHDKYEDGFFTFYIHRSNKKVYYLNERKAKLNRIIKTIKSK